MKLLVLSEYYYPHLGGAEIVAKAVIEGLAQKGHKIYVVTSRLPKSKEHEEINGVEVFRPFSTFDLNRGKSITSSIGIVERATFMVKLFSYLREFIKCHSVDVVYNIGYVTTFPAAWAASKNHLPAVNSIHSFCGRTWFHLTNPFLAMCNYLAEYFIIHFVQFDAVFCPSTQTARKLGGYFSAKAKVYVIPNPVDLREINEIKEKTDAGLVRKNLGIKNEERFLLFVGSLVKVKNVDGLIKTLSKSPTNFKLVLVGDGPEMSNIKDLIGDIGMGSRVVLLGQKSHRDTLIIISSCDILIVPSRSETFSNVSLEALVLGKPVIATKVGVLPEIDSKILYLIDDLKQINHLLGRSIESLEDKEIIHMVTQEYPIDKIVRKYESLFEEVIKWKSQS